MRLSIRGDGRGHLIVKTPYHPGAIKVLRSIPGMQWDQANKNWILDDSQSNLDAFLEKLHHTGLFSLADSIGLSRSGAVHCVSALRHFFRINYPHRYPNPADSIPVPRQSKKYPDILSKEEVFELLGSLSTIKHRFLLSLAYSYEEAKSFVLR